MICSAEPCGFGPDCQIVLVIAVDSLCVQKTSLDMDRAAEQYFTVTVFQPVKVLFLLRADRVQIDFSDVQSPFKKQFCKSQRTLYADVIDRDWRIADQALQMAYGIVTCFFFCRMIDSRLLRLNAQDLSRSFQEHFDLAVSQRRGKVQGRIAQPSGRLLNRSLSHGTSGDHNFSS